MHLSNKIYDCILIYNAKLVIGSVNFLAPHKINIILSIKWSHMIPWYLELNYFTIHNTANLQLLTAMLAIFISNLSKIWEHISLSILVYPLFLACWNEWLKLFKRFWNNWGNFWVNRVNFQESKFHRTIQNQT